MSILSGILGGLGKAFKGLGPLADLASIIPGMGSIPLIMKGLGVLSGDKLDLSSLLGAIGAGGALKFQGGDLAGIQNFLQTDKGKAFISATKTSEQIKEQMAAQENISRQMNKVLAQAMNLSKTTNLAEIDARTIAEMDKAYNAETDRALANFETDVDNPGLYDLNRAVTRGSIHNKNAENKAKLRAELEQTRPFRQAKLIPDIGGFAGALATQAQYDLGREQTSSRLFNNSAFLSGLAGGTGGGTSSGMGGRDEMLRKIMELDALRRPGEGPYPDASYWGG